MLKTGVDQLSLDSLDNQLQRLANLGGSVDKMEKQVLEIKSKQQLITETRQNREISVQKNVIEAV